MRVLVISNMYPPASLGGYELACAGVVSGLRERHAVDVLTSTYRAEEVPDDGECARDLPFVAGHLHEAPFAPWYALQAARTMARHMEISRPDVIFVWNATQIPQTVIRIAQQSGIPVVICVMEHWISHMFHRDQFTKFLLPARRPTSKRLWARIVALVNAHKSLRLDFATTQPCAVIWNAEIMRQLNEVPATSIVSSEVVIPLGTPRGDLFSQLERRPCAEPLLAFAGRVVPDKGPDLLIKASARVRRAGFPARVVIAGPVDDEYRAALTSLAQEVGLPLEALRLTGHLDERDLGDLLSQAAALIVPSRWQEPAPLVAVEAAFARVPLIAARTGGIPDQFAPDEEALFFEVDDDDGLAAQIINTLRDPAAAERRVARAANRAKEYDFTGYVAKIEAFLATAIAGSPGAPNSGAKAH